MKPFDEVQPFSRSDAARDGVGWRMLASSEYRRVAHDRHVPATTPDHLILRCRAVLPRLRPGMAFSHQTAAALWGAMVPVSSAVHVCVEGEDRIIRDGVKLHRFRYQIATGTCLGLPTTTPEVTFGHLAREVELVALVAIGDSLVRAGRTTPSRLIEMANEWPGQHRRLVAAAARYVRSEVDSPQESRTRLLITLAGLPEPECNIVLVRYDGSVHWRLDMGYREAMIAIEFDGAWHRDPAQLERDRQRREALTKQGWEMVVVTARDLHERPEAVLMQVRDALAARGRAVPKRLSDRWRRHFTVPLRVA